MFLDFASTSTSHQARCRATNAFTAQMRSLVPCLTQGREIRQRLAAMVDDDIFATDRNMGKRPYAPPASLDRLDARIVRLKPFALGEDPVVVEVDHNRDLVAHFQKVVEPEAVLVILDGQEVEGRGGHLFQTVG